MSLYTIALFLHVSGAIGACVSLGIWLFGLAALRRARLVEQVRAIAWLIILASPLMVGSVVLIGLAGFRMALSSLRPLDTLDCRFTGQRRAHRTDRSVCPRSPDACRHGHGTRGARRPTPRCVFQANP